MKKINYLVSHPIPYQVGMMKAVSKYCNLQVYYIDDYSFEEHNDNNFGRDAPIRWAGDLKSGYKYKVLKKIHKFSSSGESPRPTLFNPLILISFELLFGKCDAYWIHGYSHYSQIFIAIWAKLRSKRLFYRSESNLGFTRRGLIKDFCVKMLVRLADKLLYVSSSNKEYYEAFGAKSDQLVFMPYAIDNGVYEIEARKRDLLDTRLRLVFVGKLIARKNAQIILRALALIETKNIHLVFVGSGVEEVNISEMITKLGLNSCVEMVGFMQPQEVAGVLGRSDAIIVPSFEEAFGLVINEGMAAGCAVVASSSVGASADLVRHNENGYVFDPFDHISLAKYIDRLNSDRAMLKEFQRKSQSLIKNWSYEVDALAIKGIL